MKAETASPAKTVRVRVLRPFYEKMKRHEPGPGVVILDKAFALEMLSAKKIEMVNDADPVQEIAELTAAREKEAEGRAVEREQSEAQQPKPKAKSVR